MSLGLQKDVKDQLALSSPLVAGAFQMVEFTVKGGGDASRPTTTKDGQKMADARTPAKAEPSKAASPGSSASPTPAREGKDYAPSKAGEVDTAKPLLTYSRPKGEYKGEDSDPLMIDFWLLNGKLQGDGGTFRVRYSVDGGEAKFIDKGEPTWLSGWIAGKHQVKLELVDKDGNLVENGGYNSTTREITVTKYQRYVRLRRAPLTHENTRHARGVRTDATPGVHLYDLEDDFWWFAGMREISAALLDPVCLNDQKERLIVDVGCGTEPT
jgi:hypothetical protein